MLPDVKLACFSSSTFLSSALSSVRFNSPSCRKPTSDPTDVSEAFILISMWNNATSLFGPSELLDPPTGLELRGVSRPADAAGRTHVFTTAIHSATLVQSLHHYAYNHSDADLGWVHVGELYIDSAFVGQLPLVQERGDVLLLVFTSSGTPNLTLVTEVAGDGTVLDAVTLVSPGRVSNFRISEVGGNVFLAQTEIITEEDITLASGEVASQANGLNIAENITRGNRVRQTIYSQLAVFVLQPGDTLDGAGLTVVMNVVSQEDIYPPRYYVS
jgi:hypothetical protein